MIESTLEMQFGDNACRTYRELEDDIQGEDPLQRRITESGSWFDSSISRPGCPVSILRLRRLLPLLHAQEAGGLQTASGVAEWKMP